VAKGLVRPFQDKKRKEKKEEEAFWPLAKSHPSSFYFIVFSIFFNFFLYYNTCQGLTRGGPLVFE
jgi:hypothetical protein